MKTDRAKWLLSALADGVDPFTGEVFPQDHICNRPEIIRALHKALGALQSVPKESSAPNAGKPWTQIEEDKLLDEFHGGMTIDAMAKEHGRSRGAMTARLESMGKLPKKQK